MQTKSFFTKNPAETKKLAQYLGQEIRNMRNEARGAFCILLEGDLGSGKTLFVKGLARGLGIGAHISSPTFVLMKRYPFHRAAFKNMWHVDCYRLRTARELVALGFREIAKDRGNVVVVEWPKLVRKYIPKKALRISFYHHSPTERILDMRL